MTQQFSPEGAPSSQAQKSLIGGIGPTSSLELLHLASPAASGADAAALAESAEVLPTSGGRVLGFRRVGNVARQVESDLQPDGSGTLRLSGPPPGREENVPRVGDVLRRRLNADGATWVGVETAIERENGVDCVLRDSAGEALAVQVVSVHPDPSLWRALRRILRIAARYAPEEAADSARAAIDKKARRHSARDRAGLILALDAIDLPSHAYEPAVWAFRARNGAWATQLGFRAIWLVGPDPELTWQLDGATSRPGQS